MKLKRRTRTIIVFPIRKSINTPLADVSITCTLVTGQTWKGFSLVTRHVVSRIILGMNFDDFYELVSLSMIQ